MKKLLALLFALTLVFALVACNNTGNGNGDGNNGDGGNQTAVMSYADYMAAELESEVVVECYVQAHQSWWSDKITVYAADEDGAYFIYEMACSEENAAKLTPGAKIKVTGTKTAWAGEIEIVDATFEFVEGDDSFVAEAFDATALLGTDDLIKHQNEFVTFKGMTVKSISYKNDDNTDDIYVALTYNGAEYSFCVEKYLTGPETDVYAAVSALDEGDVIDVEGFLYWYEGANTHITGVVMVNPKNPMSYAEYIAAPLDTVVRVEAYVQANQSWWDNKVTVYAADEDGAYFIYELACSQADSEKLVQGAKINVLGTKSEWAGEIEIVDATFEFVEGDDSFVAEAFDATSLIGTDDLAKHQNEFVVFHGLTVASVSYKNGAPGDDIYVNFTYGDVELSFCVERYLTGPETEVYETVGTLNVGDVVDVEGFLYWYNGANTHITSISVAD